MTPADGIGGNHQLHHSWSSRLTWPMEKGTLGKETPQMRHTHTKPVSSMFHQVTWEGNFGCEQKEDDCLKHCWCQAQQMKGILSSPYLLPTSW